jgi:hypothetical protein
MALEAAWYRWGVIVCASGARLARGPLQWLLAGGAKLGGKSTASLAFDSSAVMENRAQRDHRLRIESVAYAANGRALEYYLALHRCQSSRLHVVTKS